MSPIMHREALELARLLEPAWPMISAGIARSGAPTCLISDDTKARARQQLEDINSQLKALREQRRVAQEELDRAAALFANTGGNQDSDEFKAAKDARARLGRIDNSIAEATDRQTAVLRLLGDVGEGAATVGIAGPPYPGTWDAHEVLAHDHVRATLSEMGSSSMPVGRVALGEIASREQIIASFRGGTYAVDVSGTPNMRRADYAGVTPQLRRQLRIFDLLAVAAMDGDRVPYTRESGSFATAAETGEGALKPEAAVTFTDDEAVAKTIAHWIKNRKQVLADFPALQGLLESRLRYGVERRLEGQILAGDGLGENLRGILSTPGVGAIAYAAGELPADQVLAAITSVYLADGEASCTVLHPTDWQTVLKAKASDGHYYSGGPFSVTPHMMWGVPLLTSGAIPQGMALVGDFAVGAQLFIREGAKVLVSDSDQDDFLRNKVTLLAEMRAALAVFQPAVFCTADFTP